MKHPLHNRWHPDIPAVAEVKDGEAFRVELVDFSGSGITNDYSADDVKHADQSIASSSSIFSLLVSFFYFYSRCLKANTSMKNNSSSISTVRHNFLLLDHRTFPI